MEISEGRSIQNSVSYAKFLQIHPIGQTNSEVRRQDSLGGEIKAVSGTQWEEKRREC